MATNIDVSRSIPELELPRAEDRSPSIGWETIALVGGIVLISVALLYLPFVLSSY